MTRSSISKVKAGNASLFFLNWFILISSFKLFICFFFIWNYPNSFAGFSRSHDSRIFFVFLIFFIVSLYSIELFNNLNKFISCFFLFFYCFLPIYLLLLYFLYYLNFQVIITWELIFFPNYFLTWKMFFLSSPQQI